MAASVLGPVLTKQAHKLLTEGGLKENSQEPVALASLIGVFLSGRGRAKAPSQFRVRRLGGAVRISRHSRWL